MNLDELNTFINHIKSLRQAGSITKEEHIQILSTSNVKQGIIENSEGVALKAEITRLMNIAIAEASA
jgi:hypothetical protein